VLLLEAGCSGENDPQVTTPGRWASLCGSKYDWNYATEAEPGLQNRRIDVPRGRIHGGSSAINAMVHIRGHRDCFDSWRALGNAGWGYEDLLPLFKRSERHDGIVTEFRGGDGPLAVSHCRDAHAGHHAFLSAAVQRGFRTDPFYDFNQPEPDGVAGFYQRNILNGRRHSAAAAFLVPALTRSNVEIRSGVQVTRVILERRRVVGVEYLQDGKVERVRATREVVLCSGTVESPRLLMVSGIGPADQLRALGIEAIANLPGVGRNLQDHLKLSIRWRGRTTLLGSTVTAGLFTSSGVGPPSDLQFYVGRGLDQPEDVVTITVSLVRPASRGSVELRSADPLVPPVIRANYLQSGVDLASLVRGAELARELGASRAYDALRSDESEPGTSLTSRSDLEHFVRQKADTIYHLAGTCRMGPQSEEGAVVDAALRVHGVDGLRVADASIMPRVVNAPTHASCVMIGEKCATLLPADQPAFVEPE
jgi:choline dehydrogenase